MTVKSKAPLVNQTIQDVQEVQALIVGECVRLRSWPQGVKLLPLLLWIKHVLDSS